MIDEPQFQKHLRSLTFSADNIRIRLVSIISAAIAVSRPNLTLTAMDFARDSDIPRPAIYEAVLQSYLFLGFPRMIEAALVYHEIFGDFEPGPDITAISVEESKRWFADGHDLCKRVYGKNYERLKNKFMAVSPDIFRWMVIEGYGKVLSRPHLTNIERELAEVAALIVDQRERQLISHILGSLNVGAARTLIETVNDDIRPLAGEHGFRLARKALASMSEKNETQE